MNDRMNGDEDLTPAEEEAFEALPRERIPPAYLEERLVGALRHEGLLGRRRSVSNLFRAAAVAAGVALFASGMSLGLWVEGRSVERVLTAALDDDATSRAARVQEAGSAYVRAVALLADTDAGAETETGLEAARVALHAAALELARANPEDPTIRLVLAVLEERVAGASEDEQAAARKTFWF